MNRKLHETFAMFEARLDLTLFLTRPTGRTLRLLSCHSRLSAEVLFSVYPQIHSGGTQWRGAEGPHRIRHRFANLRGRQRGFEATGSAVQGDREPVVKYASRAIKRIN